MEDDLNLSIGIQTQLFQMKDDLNFFVKGRQPHFKQNEYDPNIFLNKRPDQVFMNGRFSKVTTTTGIVKM